MPAAVKVCPVAELSPGSAKTVMAGSEEVVVFNVGGSYHAMANACPHRGAPLCDGRLDGAVVTCPWHGWQFDVTTGELIMNPQTKQKTYAVHVEGHDLFVDL
jgi:nitrite reductase/ring-hydroxylating ferredoxin subunit